MKKKLRASTLAKLVVMYEKIAKDEGLGVVINLVYEVHPAHIASAIVEALLPTYS